MMIPQAFLTHLLRQDPRHAVTMLALSSAVFSFTAPASRFTGRAASVSMAAPVGDITETIGNTPIVKISEKMCPPGVEIYAKCEFFNPLSSVKDRLALAIIQDAEARGDLKPGDTVVEATSGNTGIAVAMVCAQRGYNCVICMAEPFSVERRKLMRMLGAKVRRHTAWAPALLTAVAGVGDGEGGETPGASA